MESACGDSTGEGRIKMTHNRKLRALYGGAKAFACLILAGVLFTGCPSGQTALPKYSILRIGDGSGEAYAVNNLGEAVGTTAGQPFFWRSDDPETPLHILNDFGAARGINDAHVAVGEAHNKAYVWDVQNNLEFSLSPGDKDLGAAFGINAKGQVVGWAGNSDSYPLFYHAFSWNQADGFDPAFNSGSSLYVSRAFGVNLPGTIVGIAGELKTINPKSGAFEWDNQGNGAYIAGLGWGVAYGINDSGIVVGEDAAHNAFLKNADGSDGVLGGLVPGQNTNSAAHSVNVWGETAGSDTAADGNSHAVLWKDGQVYDLNSLIPAGTEWTLLAKAYCVSNSRFIVGSGKIGTDSADYPFILVPVQLSALKVVPQSVLAGKSATATLEITDNAPFPIDAALGQTGFTGAIHLADTQTIGKDTKTVTFSVLTDAKSYGSGQVTASFGGITLSAPFSVVNPSINPGTQ